jgi:hypothetical protein
VERQQALKQVIACPFDSDDLFINNLELLKVNDSHLVIYTLAVTQKSMGGNKTT